MKNRLSKSIDRLKKEKKINLNNSSESKNLSSYNVKIFRNLSEKYDLSLTINDHRNLEKDQEEKSLSLGAQNSLERIKKGETFKP